jgi:protein-S-isoprenylcysteine O-methyltransferase Ste14
MNSIFSLLRFVLFTVIFALLLGLKNVQATPLLWGYLFVIALTRFAEVFSPAANTLRNYRKDEDQSRWTSWVIGASFFTNVIAPMLEYRYKLWPELPATQWWNWVGLLLLLAGSALRIWTMLQAGEALVPHVKADAKLKLVTAGPYAQVRHPAYLGMSISYLGIAILFNSMIGAIALAVMVIPAIIFRIAKEEALLSTRLGEGWRRYQSQTPARLIPHVW